MNNYVVVLGSNLPSEFGNSAETLKKCIREIRSYSAIQALFESNWYISSSFVDEREPRYVNVGIRFSTNLKPIDLLNFTSSLEKKFGRKRQRRWQSRTCDIDILLCDQLILPNKFHFEKAMCSRNNRNCVWVLIVSTTTTTLFCIRYKFFM